MPLTRRLAHALMDKYATLTAKPSALCFYVLDVMKIYEISPSILTYELMAALVQREGLKTVLSVIELANKDEDEEIQPTSSLCVSAIRSFLTPPPHSGGSNSQYPVGSSLPFSAALPNSVVSLSSAYKVDLTKWNELNAFLDEIHQLNCLFPVVYDYVLLDVQQQTLQYYRKQQQLLDRQDVSFQQPPKAANAALQEATMGFTGKLYHRMLNEKALCSVHTFNMFMSICWYFRDYKAMIKFFSQMRSQGLQPDAKTMNIMINCFHDVGSHDACIKLYTVAKVSGHALEYHSFTNILKSMCALGRSKGAEALLLDPPFPPQQWDWVLVLVELTRQGLFSRFAALYSTMRDPSRPHHINPSRILITAVVREYLSKHEKETKPRDAAVKALRTSSSLAEMALTFDSFLDIAVQCEAEAGSEAKQPETKAW